MALIIGGYSKKKIGTIEDFHWRMKGVNNQPGYIVREATQEEYIKCIQDEFPEKSRKEIIQGILDFNKKYFYEVTTD